MTASFDEHIVRARQDNSEFIADIVEHDDLLYLVGGTNHEPVLLVSSDAVNFHRRKTPKTSGLRSMAIVDDAVFVCGEYGSVSVATEGGRWKRRAKGQTDGCLFAVRADAAGHLWICGDDGLILHSTDGGHVFQPMDAGTRSRIQNVYPDGSTVWFACFDGTLLAHRDGAFTAALTGTAALTDVVRTGLGLFVTGDGGQLYRSGDDRTFTAISAVSEEIDLEAIAEVGGDVVAVGARGTVLRSSDGRTFALLDSSTRDHFFSIAASGEGMFVGGEGGSLVHFRPADDTTWANREDTLAPEPAELDVPFRESDPDLFLAEGLPRLLGGIDATGRRPWEDDFETVWGTAMPHEIVAFSRAVEAGAEKLLYEFRPEIDSNDRAGRDENLFVALVEREQAGYLNTELTSALSGVHYLGTYGNGDSHFADVYGDAAFGDDDVRVEPSGPRKTLLFDHEEHSLAFETSRSLSRLVYFSALTDALVEETVSLPVAKECYAKVSGTVAPSWHFRYQLEDHGIAELESYDDERPVSRTWYWRSLWLVYLLRNDGVMDVADTKDVFFPRFNPPLTADVHARWRETSERFVPTALYCLLRGYFFEHTELDEYLAMGRRHTSKLVRDCAMTIDELRSGTRASLGTIEDIADVRKRFQELDLDPARAEARKAEAKARKAARKRSRAEARLRAAEMTDPVTSAWSDLADLALHEAIEARLRRMPSLEATFEAIDYFLEQKYVRENLVLTHEAKEEKEWIGSQADHAVLPLLVGALVRQTPKKKKKKKNKIALAHPVSAGELIVAFAEHGRLDSRVLPSLRALLAVDERYEHRRTVAVTALGILGDTESLPVLMTLASSVRTDDYAEASAKKGLGVALARAMGRLGDPRAIETLKAMLTAFDRAAEDHISFAAMGLADLGAIECWRDLLGAARQAQGKSKTWVLWSLCRLTDQADVATRSGIAAEIAELPATPSAALIAAAVRARCGAPPADFVELVNGAFAGPVPDAADARLLQLWALRVIGVTDLDPEPATRFLLRDDIELRTAARDALARRGHPAAPPRLLHRIEVYRYAAARRLGELGWTDARGSLLDFVKDIVDHAPVVAAMGFASDVHYSLRWTLKALLELGQAPEVTSLLDRLLTHPCRDVKDPVLRYIDLLPEDPDLIVPMMKVADEKYGWMESTATAWLDRARDRDPDAYQAALVELRRG